MSCLFDSLSHFINTDSNTIRQIICNYLESNNQIIEGIDTRLILSSDDGIQNHNHYIALMRQSSTWGGSIEIKAACNIWNTKIIIINNRDDNKIIEFIPSSGIYAHTIALVWYGNHYEPHK